jgi:hypothetical protein
MRSGRSGSRYKASLNLAQTQSKDALDQANEWYHVSYAKRFNLRYHHTGHAFEGRYRYTRTPDEEALWSMARYIHLNPVRANWLHVRRNGSTPIFVSIGTLHKASLNPAQTQPKDALDPNPMPPSWSRV